MTRVADTGPWRLPAELAAADDELLREVDAALRDGVRRAGAFGLAAEIVVAAVLAPGTR